MKWISPGLVAGNRLATFRLWGDAMRYVIIFLIVALFCHVIIHWPPAGTEGRGHMAISAGKEGLL
jgi:hypothetical protein